jgi:hypothetical protein
MHAHTSWHPACATLPSGEGCRTSLPAETLLWRPGALASPRATSCDARVVCVLERAMTFSRHKISHRQESRRTNRNVPCVRAVVTQTRVGRSQAVALAQQRAFPTPSRQITERVERYGADSKVRSQRCRALKRATCSNLFARSDIFMRNAHASSTRAKFCVPHIQVIRDFKPRTSLTDV